jgi:hypothetical protein
MTTPDAALFSIVSSTGPDRLRLAVAAYLSRYQGLSRVHADSDLRAFLTWCLQRGADPLQVSRPQVELYVRWMQEIRLAAGVVAAITTPAGVPRRIPLGARDRVLRRGFGRCDLGAETRGFRTSGQLTSSHMRVSRRYAPPLEGCF